METTSNVINFEEFVEQRHEISFEMSAVDAEIAANACRNTLTKYESDPELEMFPADRRAIERFIGTCDEARLVFSSTFSLSEDHLHLVALTMFESPNASAPYSNNRYARDVAQELMHVLEVEMLMQEVDCLQNSH